LFATNNKNISLVELRKNASNDDIEISFIKSAPSGWYPRDVAKQCSKNNENIEKHWIEFVLAATIAIQYDVHNQKNGTISNSLCSLQ
jgi:hypothetical protein